MRTGRTAPTHPHRRRKQDAAQYQAGSTFTRGFFNLIKDICDHILKKNHINDIGPDVGKGLRKNMIVNDMNSCIVISDRLNVRGVGNCLRGWMC